MEANPNQGYYSLGQQTCKVPMILFDENRKRLAAALRNNSTTPPNSVVLLQAGGEQGKISSIEHSRVDNSFIIISMSANLAIFSVQLHQFNIEYFSF